MADDGSSLAVRLTNFGEGGVNITVKVDGVGASPKVVKTELSHDNLNGVNTPADPERITSSEGSLVRTIKQADGSSQLDMQIKGYSFTVLAISKAR
jgi:alpha-L-arabinofuranosidase